MAATKTDWRTVKEIAPAARPSQEDRLRKTLCKMRDLGILRARHRPRQMSEDGTKPGGPLPVEFKLSSQWGGL